MKKISFFEIFRILVDRKKQRSKSKSSSSPSSSSTSLQQNQLHRQKSKKAGHRKSRRSTLKKIRQSAIYPHQDNCRNTLNTAIQHSSLTLIDESATKTFDEVLTSQLTIRIYSAPNDRTRDFIKVYDFGQSGDDNSNLRLGLDEEEEEEAEEQEEEKEEELRSVQSHPSLAVALTEPNRPNSNSGLWPSLNSPLQIQEPSTPTSFKSSPASRSTESMETFFSPETTDFTTIIQTIVPSEQNQILNASQQSLQSDVYSALDVSTPFLDIL
ncbi:uncharacterized protein MELLADRAFT_68284 [Melampsora larici-populina 98AG31]|uniref:Uncharacterized protein n=1 Tax=Melampsora larici-populina (strain 98AG31 / pathotype 3-4-7) TaxID=747676 RepID=F4S682_MELLP|nr:uncharacterized protein MELLADRAFT_68284 [Melampsora larici-populina 98AG31]EGF99768.1 hypothetical protein MELLADRAFT_68284 [Melampsora larici-populina 98AG31]